MENITDFISKLPQSKVINSLLIIIISLIIYKTITNFMNKSEKSNRINDKLNKKSKTYLKLITSILRYVFSIVTLLILLQVNVVNVSSMLAGVGIASVIVGLAIQDALKDIIRGISILSDEYFVVGDIVTYKDYTGKVLALGLKTTKIKDIATNNVISIANRNIEEIQKVSEDVYIKVPLQYEIKLDKAENLMEEIIDNIKSINDIDNAKYIGVTEFEDSYINYLLKIQCNPEKRLQVKRDCLGRILRTLEYNNIQIPFKQIDIHQK